MQEGSKSLGMSTSGRLSMSAGTGHAFLGGSQLLPEEALQFRGDDAVDALGEDVVHSLPDLGLEFRR